MLDPEKATAAAVTAIKAYVSARSSYKKEKDGKEWSQGMTLVGPDDKRIDEIARLVVESVMRDGADDRARIAVETQHLQTGDVFTRYAIKDGIAVDYEVSVIKVTTQGRRSTIKYRRTNDDDICECTTDATYLVAVMRPSRDELRAMLGGL